MTMIRFIGALTRHARLGGQARQIAVGDFI
jgi:hypothetical protein